LILQGFVPLSTAIDPQSKTIRGLTLSPDARCPFEICFSCSIPLSVDTPPRRYEVLVTDESGSPVLGAYVKISGYTNDEFVTTGETLVCFEATTNRPSTIVVKHLLYCTESTNTTGCFRRELRLRRIEQ
jgi:hypothetical protein